MPLSTHSSPVLALFFSCLTPSTSMSDQLAQPKLLVHLTVDLKRLLPIIIPILRIVWTCTNVSYTICWSYDRCYHCNQYFFCYIFSSFPMRHKNYYISDTVPMKNYVWQTKFVNNAMIAENEQELNLLHLHWIIAAQSHVCQRLFKRNEKTKSISVVRYSKNWKRQSLIQFHRYSTWN